MKPLLTLIATLALAGAAAAQINHPYNEIGIYTVPDPDGCATAEVAVAPSATFQCYLVLTNPWNEALNRPVSTIGGLDVQVVFPSGVLLIEATLPPNPTWDCFSCDTGEFVFPMTMPVVGDAVVLVSMRILVQGAGPYLLSLEPTGWELIPGEITFSDDDDGNSLQAMHPVSGSFDVPVFAINWDGDLSFCQTVPLRDESFGGVKALYR